METSRIIKKINQEKINHKTKYTKISQNQYTDKVVDVTVAVSDTDAQLHEERVISGREQSEIGISSSTREIYPR